PDVLRAVAPGVPWLVVVLAAVPLARSVAAAEREEGCWDLLRALAPASALLWGKVAALWAWLAATWGVATLLTVALFNASTTATGAVAAGLGGLGLAGVTVTFGAILGAERRSGMLAVLLLPAGLPALLAGTQAATPGVEAGAWIALLAAYDLVTLAVAWAAFPVLLEG
ncbi:MAG: heme exporter protein CcmB, partial [Actinomycetota bacterium]|nr:heme exporter protein CcmB [Actinomycetota bacterium]